MEKAKNIFGLILGVSFIASVLIGYGKDMSFMGEYCFISGLLVGVVLVLSTNFEFKGKSIFPEWVFLACVTDTIVILIATLLMGLNLQGAFWFIHIINPALLLIYWLLFFDCKNILKTWRMIGVLAFPLMYMGFAFFLWKVTGNCPFPASLIFVEQTIGVAVIYILGIFILLLGLGYGLCILNKLAKRAV
ncbi:MAG: hypothetical protein AB1Z19_01240 [Eubacteriales bacterium]